MSDALSLVIVAGEDSGDAHAARVLRALRELRPGLRARGFGGDRLAAEGMELHEHVRDLSVMGIWEVLKRYRYFRRIFHRLLRDILEQKPDLVLLVDYPGFTLRLARALRGSGIPVVQYICPQVWAWKQNRIQVMEQVLDGLICLFPFEPALFSDTSLPAHYCGHPLVDETAETAADPAWSPGKKLALVPGSRIQEIDRLYLPFLQAAALLKQQFPDLQIRVPVANDACGERMNTLRAGNPGLPEPELVPGRMRELVKGADAALVTSGTATLETALVDTPMVIAYKTSPLTYAVGKRVVKIKHIGMVNVIADRELCPELIQHDATPENLAARAAPLLNATPARTAMLDGYTELRSTLTSDEHGTRVAQTLLDFLPEP